VRRSILVLALMVFFVTVALGGLGLAQDIPPDQGGGPETGCEGIQNANVVQGDPQGPSQADAKSAAEEVGQAHSCKTGLPFNPYNPGSSGGQ
jgi:hypothetical protein